MSNNAHVNDDEIEIHQLPEVSTLQAGMMVAVDSQPTGTKSFNLTTALEGKVGNPATTPAEGQVLTFNGSANTWANPPEGVYVLNYTEVTDLRDIDIDRAKSQPTFIKIDTNEPINISIPDNMTISIGSVGYSLPLMPGTILKLDEIAPSSTYGEYTGPWCLVFNTLNNRGSFPTYSIGGYGVITIRLMITVPGATPAPGPYKVFSVYGKINDGSTFAGMPVPFTEFYSNGRGVGSPSTSGNEDGNALQLKLVSHDGTTRNQCILPLDIQNHSFETDSTPEQIQFMGWGSTSNRAGYKNMLTASHGFDSTNYPTQTPTVNFTRYLMADPAGNYDANQVQMSAGITVKSSDGQNTQSWAGNFVPTPGANQGYLKYWTDIKGGHMDWTSVSEVPASTSQDEGKVLTVAANGTPGWGNVTPPVTLHHHWEKANDDYNGNTEYLDFDVSSSGIKSAIVVIQMTMDAGKYVFFNVEGINMSNSAFGGTENYAHNNSEFNGIKPSVTNIMDYQYIGIKAIRIKHHGSQQHKFSTETSGIDIKVIGFK